MSSSSRRVLVSQRFFDDETRNYLLANGCEIDIAEFPQGQADGNFSHDELAALAKGAAGWIAGHARITRELLAELPELQIISRRGVGYERVDVEAAREFGKVVTIAAGGNDATVADHTIALMLAVARRLRESQAGMLRGNWSILTSSDLYRKTVGIIGLGRIGRSVVRRLSGFEANVLVVSSTRDEEYARAAGITFTDLDTLLKESDFVTLHAPLSPKTRNIINEQSIGLMKPTAILVNTARGGLVEDRHLLEALKAGRLGGAGLDVFVSEVDPAYKAVSQELLELPNVIGTPHAAASSVEGLARANMVAAECVVAVLDGKSPPGACLIADGRMSRN